MKDYDKNKDSSYIQYPDVNNLYGWTMSQKLPVNNFEWIKDTSQFNEDFMKNYNEAFLPRRMTIEKIEKLVCNLYGKTEYVIHIRNLNQALNHRLVLKKVHRVIKFNQHKYFYLHIFLLKDYQ